MAKLNEVLETLAETQKMSAATTKDLIVIVDDMAKRILSLEQRLTAQDARIRALEHGKVAYN